MNLKKISKVAYWMLPNIDEIVNLPHCSGDTADDALNEWADSNSTPYPPSSK